MPELPDVEVFKRYLDSTSLRQKIATVTVQNAKVLKDISSHKLAQKLKGRRFKSSARHGKFLFAQLGNSDGSLVLHFGMTGYLKYLKGKEEEPTHTRVLFHFTNGSRLAYVCQRMFGKVALTDSPDTFVEQRALGPDALALDWHQFRRLMRGKRGAIKSVLMDQSTVAGIGNVYSDEILFHASIDPRAGTHKLSEKALRRLYRAMGSVLKKTIQYEADPDRVPETWLLRHRRSEGKCPRCGRSLERIKMNQRSGYACPRCQKEPNSR